MFQSVSNSRTFTVSQIEDLYVKKLNELADNLVIKQRYGIDIGKVDGVQFIKIKYLLPALRFYTQDTDSLNMVFAALNNK